MVTDFYLFIYFYIFFTTECQRTGLFDKREHSEGKYCKIKT